VLSVFLAAGVVASMSSGDEVPLDAMLFTHCQRLAFYPDWAARLR
jgi:hypothetical protein